MSAFFAGRHSRLVLIQFLAVLLAGLSPGSGTAGPLKPEKYLADLVHESETLDANQFQIDSAYLHQIPLMLAQFGESDGAYVFPLPGVLLPAEEPSVSDPVIPVARPIYSSRSDNRHVRGDLFTSGLFNTIDFTYLAEEALGESIWTTLEIGQGTNNDWVVRELDYTLSGPEYNLDIVAWHENNRAYVYLDKEQRGMGVCRQPKDEDRSQLNHSSQGASVNRCLDSQHTGLGQGDAIIIRPDVDIWIQKMDFLPDKNSDGNLYGNGVEIGGGIHVFVEQQDAVDTYSWSPAVPYFVEANTTLRIARLDEDLVMSSLSFYRENPPSGTITTPHDYGQEQDDSVIEKRYPSRVDEPGVVSLMLLSLGSLFMVQRRKRLL